jgi:hypothetical protein
MILTAIALRQVLLKTWRTIDSACLSIAKDLILGHLKPSVEVRPLQSVHLNVHVVCVNQNATLCVCVCVCVRAQYVIFRLGELHGFAQWYERFGILGLKDTLVQEALDSAGALLLKAEQLSEAVLEEQTNYHHFFTWLLKGTHRMLGHVYLEHRTH